MRSAITALSSQMDGFVSTPLYYRRECGAGLYPAGRFPTGLFLFVLSSPVPGSADEIGAQLAKLPHYAQS